jgi:hypothetical protein
MRIHRHARLLAVCSLHFFEDPRSNGGRGYRTVKSWPDNIIEMNQFSPWALDYSIQMMWQQMMNRTSISLGLALLCWSVRMPLPGQRRSIPPNSYCKYAPGTNFIAVPLEDRCRCYHVLIRGEEHNHRKRFIICFTLVSYTAFSST